MFPILGRILPVSGLPGGVNVNCYYYYISSKIVTESVLLRCGGSMCASQLTNTVNSRRSGVIPVAGFCADLDEAHCNHEEGALGKCAGVVPSSRAI